MREWLKRLLKGFVPEENIHITKMPEELWPDKYWQKYGGVVEVDLENQRRSLRR
jgi:hypothetical protein